MEDLTKAVAEMRAAFSNLSKCILSLELRISRLEKLKPRNDKKNAGILWSGDYPGAISDIKKSGNVFLIEIVVSGKKFNYIISAKDMGVLFMEDDLITVKKIIQDKFGFVETADVNPDSICSIKYRVKIKKAAGHEDGLESVVEIEPLEKFKNEDERLKMLEVIDYD